MVALARVPRVVPAVSADGEFAADAIAGLRATPKRISAKYFYDAEGSRLFDEITRLSEYYPTRCEMKILREHGKDIAKLIPEGGALVEFGSGSSKKVRLLLNSAPTLAAYVPVDICAEMVEAEAAELKAERPQLPVIPVIADFCKPFELPEIAKTATARVGLFPGSTIGNFESHEASDFLRNAGKILGEGAVLIIGVDLIKASEVLNLAYNDLRGITAKFNKNVLVRMNRELGANFKLDSFEHHAFYNRERSRVEMHLASRKRQKVRVAGESIDFRAGETIHTENSYKYSIEMLNALAGGAGWTPVQAWTDPKNYFAVAAFKLSKLEKPARPG